MKLKVDVGTKAEVQDDGQRLEELDDCLKERMSSTEVSVICHSIFIDLHYVHNSMTRGLLCFIFEKNNIRRWNLA
jgi:hypothetical protein